jgi:Redoxin
VRPFELPGTDGATHMGGPGTRPAVVVFTCNHCPYALAWHDRLLETARDYGDRADFTFVSSNDASRYPRDSFEAMERRVAGDGGWPAPYLFDETQDVAREYGARVTPDVFVFDAGGRLAYRGAPDADYRETEQRAVWVRGALDAVLAGRRPDPAETEPVGCSIKWKA